MSRLTDKNTNACVLCGQRNRCTGNDCELVKLYDKLKYYEDLEEAGHLIELPCKVGDTVYYIDIDQGKVEHSTVNWISIGRRLSWLRLKNKKNIVFCDKLGGGSDVFFLTEEEAYAELSRIFQAMQDELEAEAEWVAMEGGTE